MLKRRAKKSMDNSQSEFLFTKDDCDNYDINRNKKDTFKVAMDMYLSRQQLLGKITI